MSVLLVQIFLLVASVLFLLACLGERNRFPKGLYGVMTVCLIILLLVSMSLK